MSDLLPFYERELAFLRQASSAFAQQYPKVAGRLQLSGDVSPDPHVERMIESFALLAARVHKRLDDDFPLFTESLLEVLYPNYLRPFPACSIAQFDLGATAATLSAPARVERGTVLTTRPVKGLSCRFTTTQDVNLLPLRVSAVTFRNAINAPDGVALPSDATAVLSITLDLLAGQFDWRALAAAPLRFFLDAEPSQVSVLRDALCAWTRRMYLQTDDVRWHAVHDQASGVSLRPAMAGFAPEEALLPFDARSADAYRLLTEYFAFPDKFNFVDVPLSLPDGLLQALAAEAEGTASTPRRITLHLVLGGLRSDSDAARLLETIEVRHLALGCTPVVNLFDQPADPIRITHEAAAYPVVVDARHAYAYEVFCVERVYRVRQTSRGETVDEFRPFFSLCHADVLQGEGAVVNGGRGTALEGTQAGSAGQAQPCYWSTSRDDTVAQLSPGYETELSLVDLDFNPAVPQTETLSVQVKATNRDLPAQLPVGVSGGDLFSAGGGVAREIRLLRKPTATRRFHKARGGLWRLISHLSLNHLSLSEGGLDALKELMRLYDLTESQANRRQVDGLVSVSHRAATAWLPGQPFATFVRGTEVRLTVDEQAFVGTGLSLFAAVMDRFFGLYAHINSFTQLTVISSRTNEVVMACPPRSGAITLL